ncbi:MAG: helix-turn-helix domain-containing protein [Pseudonocardiaceae bacterium]
MVPLRLSTADYPESARNRLAVAVVRAREAAGLTSQQDLADRAEVSKRSVVYVEKGEPRVGRKVLEKIGRVLPGWTEDTPREILEGAEPPGLDRDPASDETVQEPQPGDYPDQMEYLNAQYWYMREGLGMSHEAIMRGFNMAAAIYTRRHTQGDQSSADRDTSRPTG